MAVRDKRLARIARLKSDIEETKRLIDRQMKMIELGVADDSDGWVLLVNLEEALKNHEGLFAQLLGDDEKH